MIVAALKVRAAIDRFPPPAQERLRSLQRRLETEGRFWEPRDRLHDARLHKPRLRDRLVGGVIGLIVMLLILAVLIGLYNIVLFVIHAG
jgi:hypothetical protein